MNKSKTVPFEAEPLAVLLRGPLVGLAPAQDRRVRKPGGSVLPEAGELVDVDADWAYWARRFSDGDVIVLPDFSAEGAAA